MIDKSKESRMALERDICMENTKSPESLELRKKKDTREKRFTFRDYLKLDTFIISQSSWWKTVFDTVILIVIGYSCMTTVFYVSFDKKAEGTWRIVDLTVTSLFGLDFVFNFFQEYQDKETFQKIRDHKKIAVKYFKSGWMILDFIATFPFDLFADVLYTKLIRLMRLSKLINLLDISRIKRIVKSYFDRSTRSDRI